MRFIRGSNKKYLNATVNHLANWKGESINKSIYSTNSRAKSGIV